ncbi:WGR domain-containing protein [Rhizobium sp. WYCCWR 11128]|uniref:WGR domain-containing protein n=1 Tax=Rhizobium sp. WYCCWR 11128 TaxID=2749832 RepID=UPI0015D1D522|nr:WGR domain-containing protein [Rhizobium sp. WYCCWR 11128]NYT32056.1 WGR domain-containing protein [Rhizobium sp. WYCCWR 11128]
MYTPVVQLTLFGEVSLVRAWGRIRTRGQQIGHLFDKESQAINLLLKNFATSDGAPNLMALPSRWSTRLALKLS